MSEVKAIEDQITRIQREVPNSLMEDCVWFEPFMGTTIEDMLKVSLINAERHERCYLLNKNKIKFLRSINSEGVL